MKKIILAAINARYSHPNLALRYLRSYVSDLDYECILKEFSLKAQTVHIVEEIITEKPHALGLSVYIWNVEQVKKIVHHIKQLAPNIIIILGGPEVSYCPEQWLSKHPEIDYIICGSGEAGFRHLLENDLQLNQQIISLENPPFRQIPFPYANESPGSLKNRYIYYESSRGCPYRCTYCISSRSEQKLEHRDTETVSAELDILMSYSPDYIKFVDRTFNADKSKSRAIWKYIISEYEKSSTSFHFEVNPSLLTDEDFTLLKSCPPGLFQFEAGIQSVHPETLRAIQRYSPWEKTKPLLHKLLELKTIHIHVDLLAGLPHEGLSEIAHSFNEIYRLKAHHFQLGLLKILKGTEMKTYADSHNYIYGVRAPYKVQQTPWLTADEMNRIEVIAHLIDHLYNSHHFTLTLENLVKEFSSPFDLYKKMADLYTQEGSPPISGWEHAVLFIIEFINSCMPDTTLFYKDCITWDWASRARDTRIPAVIQDDTYRELRKKALKHLSKIIKEQGSLNVDNIQITETTIKKTIIAVYHSELFKNKYAPHSDYTLFITEKKAHASLYTVDGVNVHIPISF